MGHLKEMRPIALMHRSRRLLPSVTVIRAMLWAGLSWVLMTVALWPAVRYHHVPVIYAATLPFGGALFGLMTATSAWRHLMGRGPSWRGRTYDAS